MASRQSENFVTEAFVHLLIHLTEFEPVVAIKLISSITENKLPLDLDSLKSLNISTQVSTNLGRPDIELSTLDSLVYIEVKTDSDFGIEQLHRYRELLNTSGIKNTVLIIITRHPISLISTSLHDQPDVSFRWHHIADFLEGCSFDSEISLFLGCGGQVYV